MDLFILQYAYMTPEGQLQTTCYTELLLRM